ncbi:MAG: hypothetical protein ABIJ08_02235, partial [Nanoarchaeota archaeon]
FIMISSVFGVIFYGFGSQDTTLKYKNLKFTREDSGWSTTINNQRVFFDYFPEELENINISSEIVDMLKNKYEIDVTSEINSTFKDTIALAEYNMAQVLNDILSVYLRPGFTQENEYLPAITCSDATLSVPLIYFIHSNQTSITLDGDCIIAEAINDNDFLRIKDRILYSILGIIE